MGLRNNYIFSKTELTQLRFFKIKKIQQVRKILVATSKGLVVFETVVPLGRKRAKTWEIAKVHFLGLPATTIYHAPSDNNSDSSNGTWWLGLAHRHWGQKLHVSKDEGETWQMLPPPKYPANAFLSSGKNATLKKIWTIQHAGKDDPTGLWIGTEPGGLFYSKEDGENLELVKGLWNHPSRKDQNQWFGAGRDFPFIHSIVVDPRDSQHVYIAVSCAGVFETTDGGENWQPRNNGLKATYLPNPNVEVGHDPHLLLACKKNPDVLWQQNHCGIFRSVDGGKNWQDVSDKNGIADYGFALAIDHENPERAWVIPAVSDEIRVAHDLALTICRTDDGGQTWKAFRNGLPQAHCFDIVFRHSLAIHQNEMVFGTTTGNLYFSENYGEDWICLSSNLARIEGVTFS